jgi:hypothetical protein
LGNPLAIIVQAVWKPAHFRENNGNQKIGQGNIKTQGIAVNIRDIRIRILLRRRWVMINTPVRMLARVMVRLGRILFGILQVLCVTVQDTGEKDHLASG